MTIMMEVEMMAIWKNVIALAALETTSIMMTTRLLMMATLASECDFDLAWPTFHDDVDAEADADDNDDDDDDSGFGMWDRSGSGQPPNRWDGFTAAGT